MPTVAVTPESLKSERSAKIRLTKLEGQYEAARDRRNGVNAKGQAGGWDEALFREREAHEALMALIVQEMRALSGAAAKRGWHVTGRLLRYWDSPTAALVAANID